MARLNREDEYDKNYYFNQKLCNGIRIVADIERTNKKQGAELLMRAGLCSYMGAKLTEHIERERAARELNQKVRATRFVLELRKLARERGMDIS